ncbi:MAG: DUF1922 domain-containing protein [Candidatus Lokiarchaeota archaeon]|nr:DUF1922 domain-containing protein [Candidatus Lokiarchaeota archaeon]
MNNTQKYSFFRCYHCGEWYYTKKMIKTKKCVTCNRTFQFKSSTKFSRICSIKEAILIIKQLKGNREMESLSTYFLRVENVTKSKNE